MEGDDSNATSPEQPKSSNEKQHEEEIQAASVTKDAVPEIREIHKLSPASESKDCHKDGVIEADAIPSEEAIEWHTPFGESTFTFLFMCEPNSRAFWYAIFVYSIQLSTTVLMLVDIIDLGGSNPIQLPPMVGLPTTLAQAVIIFIVVAFQSDLMEAVSKLHDGYYPPIMEVFPGATYPTWLVSCIAQLIAGIFLLATNFILTMQVDNVVAGMLNFAALHFIAEIDDTGFQLAKLGFVTHPIQVRAWQVADFHVPKRDKGNTLKRGLYMATLVSLFIGYGILKGRQLHGYYLPTYLFVQFGDAFNTELAFYSGLFESEYVRTAGHRSYRDIDTKTILLAYCDREKAWTFSGTNDPCDFFARTLNTDTYDVTTVPWNDWLVRDRLTRLQPFESFKMFSKDCDSRACQGKCEKGLCICPPATFGFDCEFTKVCPEMILNGKFDPFPEASGNDVLVNTYTVGDRFHLLRDETGELVKVYSMPVYYSKRNFPASIIFFSGRRWAVTNEFFLGLSSIELLLEGGYVPNRTASFLQNWSFHGHHATYNIPKFMSDPVDFQTSQFLPSPVGLRWSEVVVADKNSTSFDVGDPIDTVLSCLSCLPIHGGFCDPLGGECIEETGLCDCNPGYSGGTCEIVQRCYDQKTPCSARGVCDNISGVCRCEDPWKGKLCEDVHYCVDEKGKCFNGGFCDVSSSWLYCDCSDPATVGVACEYYQDCTIFGCVNGGVCNQHSRSCSCNTPYYGAACQLVDSTLDAGKCFEDDDCHNGSCNTTAGTCMCSEPGRHGVFCEHQHNCTKDSCLNGGLCNQESGHCECKVPTTGFNCDEVPSCQEDADCLEPGTCFFGICFCNDTLHAGNLCQNTRDCTIVGCHNNGTCQDDGKCLCDSPFHGFLCEYVQVKVL